MKVLVVGSGAREHALTWSIKKSALVRELYVAPGNPGTALIAQNIPLKVDAIEELLQFALDRQVDLTVVGPEYPLSLGIVDKFRARGLRIFGPSSAASRLETSKSFAKDVMRKAGVKTAQFESFDNLSGARSYLSNQQAPFVLKADGLAAGKGVLICQTKDEAQAGLNFLFGELGCSTVLIERYLRGREASFIVATDGKRIVPFASSHDYKRVFDADRGPNTGGMGSVSPTPRLSTQQEEQVIEEVIKPVLIEMEQRGMPFSGFLYAGLMIDEGEVVWVLEFNARFGDPECQSVMLRLESDLAKTLYDLSEVAAPAEKFQIHHLRWSEKRAVCVVLAAQGYPEKPKSGDKIQGLQEASEIKNAYVFHAGTALDGDEVRTSGGRVLSVTAAGDTYQQACMLAYQVCDTIIFDGKHCRRDIGKS